jgi:hypothetical protein
MHIVKSIGILSVAKMMGAIYAVLGLIFIPIFLIAVMAGLLAGQREATLGAGVMLVLALIFPVLYGAIGFIAGAHHGLAVQPVCGMGGRHRIKTAGPLGSASAVCGYGDAADGLRRVSRQKKARVFARAILQMLIYCW